MTESRVSPFSSDPDRIVIAGDWHGDRIHAASVIQWAARNGAAGIVQLGDFGIWPGAAGRSYLAQVQLALDLADMWLVFVDGNHEDFTQLLAKPLDGSGARPVMSRITHIPRGFRWTWHDRVWMGLGGATSLDRPFRKPHVSWWPEESLTGGDLQRAADSGPVDVMVTHDAPAGYDVPGIPPASTWLASEVDRANAHREMMRAAVVATRPEWLFHGHFHSRYSLIYNDLLGHHTLIEGLDDNTAPFHKNVILWDVKAMTEVPA